MSYIVYILVNNSNNKTYVGITNNPARRIRQHNGELVGGAKYTTSNKGLGKWDFFGFIKNLDKITALKIEYRIKFLSRKKKGSPIDRRLEAIDETLKIFNNDELNLSFEYA